MLLALGLLGCGASDAADRHAIQAVAFRWVLEEEASEGATVCADVEELSLAYSDAPVQCADLEGDRAALLETFADEVVDVSTCRLEPLDGSSLCDSTLVDANGAPAVKIAVGCPVEREDGGYDVAVVLSACEFAVSGFACTVRRSVLGWRVEPCTLLFTA